MGSSGSEPRISTPPPHLLTIYSLGVRKREGASPERGGLLPGVTQQASRLRLLPPAQTRTQRGGQHTAGAQRRKNRTLTLNPPTPAEDGGETRNRAPHRPRALPGTAQREEPRAWRASPSRIPVQSPPAWCGQPAHGSPPSRRSNLLQEAHLDPPTAGSPGSSCGFPIRVPCWGLSFPVPSGSTSGRDDGRGLHSEMGCRHGIQ